MRRWGKRQTCQAASSPSVVTRCLKRQCAGEAPGLLRTLRASKFYQHDSDVVATEPGSRSGGEKNGGR